MKIKKEISFPDDFFDFTGGKEISQEETIKWVDECLEKINFSKESDNSSIMSGDTFVNVKKNKNKLEVIVSKSHFLFSCDINDLIKNKTKSKGGKK